MISGFLDIVFTGNLKLTKMVLKQILQTNGWGVTVFHDLALTALSGKDVENSEIKKINVKKKSLIGQVTPLHLCCLNPSIEV
ncbi:unnamed protein product, partial [Rotaria magnacalcarata]